MSVKSKNFVENPPSYLDIFGIQLFIQREALDCALVTCMKGAKLDPLIGRVSVREQRHCYLKSVSEIEQLISLTQKQKSYKALMV